MSTGRIEMQPQKSDQDEKGAVLPKWHSAVVDKMNFKLVRKS